MHNSRRYTSLHWSSWTTSDVSSTLLLWWIKPEPHGSGFFSCLTLQGADAIIFGFLRRGAKRRFAAIEPPRAPYRMHTMKTFSAKPAEVQRDWFVVDGTDKVLGRLAAELAHRLRGKHKPEFTPHVDTGDFIVVVNAAKIRVTGNKGLDKKYYRHSGYPGGITETNFSKMQSRFPGRALEKAVKGMLPKGPLGYAMIKKLKVYAEGSHPHTAQQPKALEL